MQRSTCGVICDLPNRGPEVPSFKVGEQFEHATESGWDRRMFRVFRSDFELLNVKYYEGKVDVSD